MVSFFNNGAVSVDPCILHLSFESLSSISDRGVLYVCVYQRIEQFIVIISSSYVMIILTHHCCFHEIIYCHDIINNINNIMTINNFSNNILYYGCIIAIRWGCIIKLFMVLDNN